MSRGNRDVEAFFKRPGQWQEAFRELRAIVLDSGLAEEWKWRAPCYTLGGANVAILQGFKEYCALMFFKGALLEDPEAILVAPGRSQAGRQVRFTGAGDVVEMKPVLKAYLREAMAVEEAGLEVELKETVDYAVPEEFQRKLDGMPALKAAFEKLTPGRQRAYLLHFSSAKRSATRASRVEKCVPRILDGKGLNDR